MLMFLLTWCTCRSRSWPATCLSCRLCPAAHPPWTAWSALRPPAPRANGRWPPRSKEMLRRHYWSGSSTQSPSKFLAGVCSKKPLIIEVRLWLSTHCSGCRICGDIWMNDFAAGLLSLLPWVKMQTESTSDTLEKSSNKTNSFFTHVMGPD